MSVLPFLDSLCVPQWWNRRGSRSAFDFHSVTGQTFPLLHTAKDQMEAVKVGEYQASYKRIQAYIPFIDSNLPVPPPDRKR